MMRAILISTLKITPRYIYTHKHTQNTVSCIVPINQVLAGFGFSKKERKTVPCQINYMVRDGYLKHFRMKRHTKWKTI